MEKYSKILIYIFLLCIVNSVISIFLIYKIFNLPVGNTAIQPKIGDNNTKSITSPTPVPKAADQSDIKSDLTIIKAEIRAIRESLDNSGLIIATPTP